MKNQKQSPSESVAVSAAPSALPAQAVGEKVTDEQIVATAREKQKRLAHWDYDDLVSFARAILALAAPMPQPEPTSKGAMTEDEFMTARGCPPRKFVRYGDCKCILTQHCDGTCNPIYEDAPPAPSQQREPQEAAEPVKWMQSSGGYRFFKADGSEVNPAETPLYLSAPQEAGKLAATEIDLPTDHDVLEHCDQNGTTLAEAAFALAKPSKEAGKVEPVADERQPSDGDYLRWAEQAGAKINWDFESASSARVVFLTASQWGRFCDKVRALHLRPTQQALSDEEIKRIHDEQSCLPDLVGRKEQWPEILRFARAILAAAGGGEK